MTISLIVTFWVIESFRIEGLDSSIRIGLLFIIFKKIICWYKKSFWFKKIGYLFFQNPPQIVTFSLEQKEFDFSRNCDYQGNCDYLGKYDYLSYWNYLGNCDYLSKCDYLGCDFSKWEQYLQNYDLRILNVFEALIEQGKCFKETRKIDVTEVLGGIS